MPIKNIDEAIRIIHNCAVSYSNNLMNKNTLFVTSNESKIDCFEALFRPENFLHLTGVKTNLEARLFLYTAVNRKLSPSSITIDLNGTAGIKLEILPRLMSIHIMARMVGDYDNTKPLLITDKFAGTVTMAMGFAYNNGLYIPNTALKLDVRDITSKATRRKVAAIFVKPSGDNLYKRLTYIAKGITIDDDVLAPMLKEKVDTESLTADFPIPRKSTE